MGSKEYRKMASVPIERLVPCNCTYVSEGPKGLKVGQPNERNYPKMWRDWDEAPPLCAAELYVPAKDGRC